jgi:hypothetical protein
VKGFWQVNFCRILDKKLSEKQCNIRRERIAADFIFTVRTIIRKMGI